MRGLSQVALLGGALASGALTAGLAGSSTELLAGVTAPGADPAAAVTGLAALLAAALLGWATTCLGLALAAELPGTVGVAAARARDRVTPVVVRRWAAIVLGASVSATVLPGTAVASVRSDAPSPGWTASSSPTTIPNPAFTTTDGTGPHGARDLPSPGWVRPSAEPTAATDQPSAPGWRPSRPPATHRGDAHLLTGRPGPAGDHDIVVIRRGDTLWSIAAAHLGPDATDVEIARAWPRWHAANRSTIGEDPHTLLPGTELTPPPAL